MQAGRGAQSPALLRHGGHASMPGLPGGGRGRPPSSLPPMLHRRRRGFQYTHTHTCTHTCPPRADLSRMASFQNVTEKQKACETDLAKAEPALLAAQEALDTLNKVRTRKERNGTGPRRGVAGGEGEHCGVWARGCSFPQSPGGPGPSMQGYIPSQRPPVVSRTT